MGIVDSMRGTPWWFATVLPASTVVIGIYGGTPIAVRRYRLDLPSEVSQLFALMLFVYFYVLIPLCLLSAVGLKVVRGKSNKVASAAYVFLCVIAVPAAFYGIGASYYYG